MGKKFLKRNLKYEVTWLEWGHENTQYFFWQNLERKKSHDIPWILLEEVHYG